jgi:hypothetical protein
MARHVRQAVDQAVDPLRSLAAHGAAVRAAQPRAAAARARQAAKDKADWLPRLIDIAKDAPASYATLHAVATYVRNKLLEGEDTTRAIPSVRSIVRWLPPLRQLRSSVLD